MAIPVGYHSVTPVLIVNGGQKLIDFMKQAFDAKETFCMKGPGQTIAHAELEIGDSTIMLSDAHIRIPGQEQRSLFVCGRCRTRYTDRPSRLAAGRSAEPTNQFYGDRSARVTDAFGNHWAIATRVEEVPTEELERRAQGYAKQSTKN